MGGVNLFWFLRQRDRFQEWLHRRPGLAEMPPMPPLPLGCPSHERPDMPLTGCERVRFAMLADLYQDLEAADPMEQPGDR
jgi:hypothetical protein